MMKALIIGGSGGLSSVVARLAMEKYKVWAVTRGQRKLPGGVVPIIADRNNAIEFEHAVSAAGTKWDAFRKIAGKKSCRI